MSPTKTLPTSRQAQNKNRGQSQHPEIVRWMVTSLQWTFAYCCDHSCCPQTLWNLMWSGFFRSHHHVGYGGNVTSSLSAEVTFSCFPKWEGDLLSSFPAEEVPEAPGLWKWGERPSWASRRSHQLGELSDWAKGMRWQWRDHEGRGAAQHGFWAIESQEDNFFFTLLLFPCVGIWNMFSD